MPSPVAFEEVATDEREIALFAQELCIGLAHRLDDFNPDLATIAANGKTTLAPALTNAITSAEAAADARALAVANARARPGGRQRARRR